MKKIVLFLYVLGFATGPTFLDARPAAVEYDDYDEDYDDDDYYDEDYIDPTDLNAIHNNINENLAVIVDDSLDGYTKLFSKVGNFFGFGKKKPEVQTKIVYKVRPKQEKQKSKTLSSSSAVNKSKQKTKTLSKKEKEVVAVQTIKKSFAVSDTPLFRKRDIPVKINPAQEGS